ncbi:MAG: histidine--tRNA ligase [Deltaproteobacteria bacterium]|nr:histidine--tRNA ligase [Deltaproteobacteria bacterium]
MTDTIRAVRGMKDLLPPESRRWQQVEAVSREIFARYGYQEIRLPLLERTELFARSIGADTDIVAKEMYTFTDRHGDSLTLRPEATAQVVRAYLENGLHLGAGVKKFFTIGPMFRYERPQKGRYRQFHQINGEALGVDVPELDVEVILLLLDILKHLGLRDLELLINSLGCPVCQVDFKARLTIFLARREGWCDDCLRRRAANPLRVLDCKSQNCQALLMEAPLLRDCLDDDCRRHYDRVLELLSRFGVPYTEQPRLVRGLDYYTRTAFEVTAGGLGAQDAVAGGGRYNGLVKELGGPDLPGIGFAIGQDRLMEILPEQDSPAPPRIFLAALGPPARETAFSLLRELRRQGLAAEFDFQDRSLKAQLSLANRLGASFTVILGDRELAQGRVLVRRMDGGEQQTLPLDGLAAALAALIAREKDEHRV